MKILCIGDFHITDKKPENRIDDYWGTVKRKLRYILSIAKKQDVSVIVSPGDLTDIPSLSYSAYSDIVDIFNEYLCRGLKFLTVFGQHDMRYRTQKNTALYAFQSALSPNFHIIRNDESIEIEDIHFRGSSYSGLIPDPPEKFSILLIHKMIIEEKLWSKQEEYESSSLFIRQHPYNIIVSGDNHHSFLTKTKGGRILINCGAIMRSNIDQVKHKPFVILIDTLTMDYEYIYIPIEAGEKVFNVEQITESKERNERIEAFISGLSTGKVVSLQFEDNLRDYITKNNINESISSIIFNSMIKEKQND